MVPYIHRQFEQKNLGQMKTVYPTAFVFRQEKNIPGNYDNQQRSKYHLTVECRLEEEADRDGSKGVEAKGRGATSARSTNMPSATTLLRRRKKFHCNLTEIAKKHHEAFLASLSPPLSIPDEKILRWHPAFALDTVPEIEAATLPAPPIKETYTTAKDVLTVAQGRLAPRVQAALASVGESGVDASGERVRAVKREESAEEVKSDVSDPALKGVSPALLEKVHSVCACDHIFFLIM